MIEFIKYHLFPNWKLVKIYPIHRNMLHNCSIDVVGSGWNSTIKTTPIPKEEHTIWKEFICNLILEYSKNRKEYRIVIDKTNQSVFYTHTNIHSLKEYNTLLDWVIKQNNEKNTNL